MLMLTWVPVLQLPPVSFDERHTLDLTHPVMPGVKRQPQPQQQQRQQQQQQNPPAQQPHCWGQHQLHQHSLRAQPLLVLAGLVWLVVVLFGLQRQAAGLTTLPAVRALLLLVLLTVLLLQEPVLQPLLAVLMVLPVLMALLPADNTKHCLILPPETTRT